MFFLSVQNLDWSHSNPQLPLIFTNFMVDIWRIHPFREGNTRTISVFMKLFAEQNHLKFNAVLLSLHTGFLRNSLVLAAVQEAPDVSHLLKIISDALTYTPHIQTKNSAVDSEKYHSIGKYDVSNYEEKPFYTKKPKQD
ncbi:Fic family protein [Kurthia zopfii]